MKVALVLAFITLAQATSFYEVVITEWEEWKLLHGKDYENPTEESFRMKIFMENKEKISKHNARFHEGKEEYQLKMNHFGDMLTHEFKNKYNGYRHDVKLAQSAAGLESEGATFISPANVKLPKEVDWRTKGAVTPVKNQGQCGSCWAFSTTGSLEGQHFRKSGKMVSLSEQQLVDCSIDYGNNGCNGGLMDNAFKYIRDNGGLDTEGSYPYDAEDEQCHFRERDVGATDKGFVDVLGDDDLMEAVATVGPVSIAINAGLSSFQFYNKGVYYDQDCDPQDIDHGVLLVGYGEEDGKKYWLVKNSWGTTWGDQGYIKMSRDHENFCGISSSASYPLV